jgi:ribosome modulation factor
MDDLAAAPPAASPAQIAEDEGFEAFVAGLRIEDNPYLGTMLDDLMSAWLWGWRMAARYASHEH